jgi:hypothetical protein
MADEPPKKTVRTCGWSASVHNNLLRAANLAFELATAIEAGADTFALVQEIRTIKNSLPDNLLDTQFEPSGVTERQRMSKKPTTEQRFQKWVDAFRTGQPCLSFLLALPSMTDDELRPLWQDADRRARKLRRDREYIKAAREAHARAWEEAEARKKD